MAINFIPSDPSDKYLPTRVITPRPNRTSSQASFTLITPQPAEHTYDLATQTDEFLFWQTREAALAALEAWDDVSGSPFAAWQGNRKSINLIPNNGEDLNAYYDRESLSFFHITIDGQTFLSGASPDVVAHEVGHGILDAIRPELMASPVFEVNSFHEAFGDCVALLTALHDGPTRAAVFSSVAQSNFVEATAENFAEGIKAFESNHNASVPRRALNKLKWQLPSTLPDFGSDGDGPGELINEIHSFGQIFSGCFYDTIVNILGTSGAATDDGLVAAARTAGRLLARAVATAPVNTRFYREVGRAMVKADEEENGAANRTAIKSAFESHNIPLGTGAMLAPVAALAGPAPRIEATEVTLAANVKRDLLGRIDAVGKKVITKALRIGGEAVAEVLHNRQIPLDRLDKQLKGVVALASEAILVGDSGGYAAILGGSLPEPAASADEVECFIRSLLKQGGIAFKAATKKIKSKSIKFGSNFSINPVTHTIKSVGGKKILTRFRYACPRRQEVVLSRLSPNWTNAPFGLV